LDTARLELRRKALLADLLVGSIRPPISSDIAFFPGLPKRLDVNADGARLPQNFSECPIRAVAHADQCPEHIERQKLQLRDVETVRDFFIFALAMNLQFTISHHQLPDASRVDGVVGAESPAERPRATVIIAPYRSTGLRGLRRPMPSFGIASFSLQ